MENQDKDEAWQRRIKRCVDAVRQWEPRTREPDTIEPGSSLHSDDQHWKSFPASSAAWYGLVTAVDHLALVADQTQDGTNLRLRPSSPFTVTRAALLGASQAVWVLSGSRSERIRRTLVIAEDERKLHRTFLRDYMNDPFTKVELSSGFLEELGEMDKKLTDEIDAIRDERTARGDKETFQSTKMMQEAAKYVCDDDASDQWVRLALSYGWRMASAAAHARQWPFFVRPTEKLPSDAGVVVRRMSTSFADFGQSLGAATLMTSEAWRLWDLRRRRHRP